MAYQYYLRILIGIYQVSASTSPQHLEKEQKARALMWRTLALFPHVMCWMPFISSGSVSCWLETKCADIRVTLYVRVRTCTSDSEPYVHALFGSFVKQSKMCCA